MACVRCGERKRRKENADCPLNFPAFKGQRARLTAQITYRVRWLRQSQSYDCGYRFSPSTLSTHMQLWKYKADESNLNKGMLYIFQDEKKLRYLKEIVYSKSRQWQTIWFQRRECNITLRGVDESKVPSSVLFIASRCRHTHTHRNCQWNTHNL